MRWEWRFMEELADAVKDFSQNKEAKRENMRSRVRSASRTIQKMQHTIQLLHVLGKEVQKDAEGRVQ